MVGMKPWTLPDSLQPGPELPPECHWSVPSAKRKGAKPARVTAMPAAEPQLPAYWGEAAGAAGTPSGEEVGRCGHEKVHRQGLGSEPRQYYWGEGAADVNDVYDGSSSENESLNVLPAAASSHGSASGSSPSSHTGMQHTVRPVLRVLMKSQHAPVKRVAGLFSFLRACSGLAIPLQTPSRCCKSKYEFVEKCWGSVKCTGCIPEHFLKVPVKLAVSS